MNRSQVLAAADVGDWAAYTQAQGGALVARRDLVVRLAYEITEQGNEYAEDVQRISFTGHRVSVGCYS
ncbi:TPA: hypothetical protein J0615_000126 [Escherichia coli]|nr:hypothetical protein [Escherichia coli]